MTFHFFYEILAFSLHSGRKILNFSLFSKIPKNHFMDLEKIDIDNLTYRRPSGALLPSIEAKNTIFKKKILGACLFK